MRTARKTNSTKGMRFLTGKPLKLQRPIARLLMVCLICTILLTACQNTLAEPLPTTTPSTVTESATATMTASATISAPTQVRETPTATITPGRRVTLMAVGDIMLGRTIGDLIETEGIEAPFLYTGETLRSADITVGNLECPLSARGDAVEKTYVFRAPTIAGESLAYAGFDLVNLANNHSLDYGPLALEDTLNTLAVNNIHAVGAGMDETAAYAPVILEIDGLRIAFLGFTDIPPGNYDYQSWEAGPTKPGVAWAHEEKVRESVQSAKNQADVVIVMVHNGYEFVQTVSGFQQATARLAIDSGAALVIGSHPHVLQRIETYHDGLIVYSMGNFVFDNFLFPPNYSAILVVELSPRGVESYELIDVIVQLNGVPQIMPYKSDKKP